MPAPLPDMEQHIAYRFRDRNLLERALIHKSYANEHRVLSHNERMEFLGDSVLNLVVSEYLMKTCPDSNEGDLSRLRAAVVSEAPLAVAARKIDLGSYLLLGRGEEQSGGRNKDSLLSDCLEALIAAIYLDGGKEAAETFIIMLLADAIGETCAAGVHDYKTELQELCQNRLKQLPDYRIVGESGPDHQKQFSMEVWIGGKSLGRGIGRNKKEAEQRAAKKALAALAGQQVFE